MNPSPQSDYLDPTTRDNAAVLFIDNQNQLLMGVQSIDTTLLRLNTEALAKLAEMYGLPVVLTTAGGGAEGAWGPLLKPITDTSRTYVTEGGRVVAFYAPPNGAVAHKDVSAKTRRNMPDPIPVMVLARLVVDSAYQKQGLGSALLKDALLRTIAAAQIVGVRAVLLHAMSDDAKRFYERAGFHECPVDPMMMMITLAEVEKNLSPPSAS